MDALGISIIECGGKTGVIYFAGVCKGLGIKGYFGLWDKDEEVDKKALLEAMLQNKNGIEFNPNLEKFLTSKESGVNLSSSSNNKVKQIHDWVIGSHPENIPSEFDALKRFISNEVLEPEPEESAETD